MHEIEVWAPKPGSIAVEVDGVVHPMNGPDERGWWRAQVADATAGAAYGFRLDDDERAYPDPRSLRQPKGVHALSEIYDQTAYRWSDADWQPVELVHAVIYELHVGTFTPEGTFASALARLDYLIDLGITHVELMPVAAFAGDRGWGYDGVALFAVTETYGGPDGLKRFVDTCHAKGLAVLLDVVYNHFGPVGNYTGKYGPYGTARHTTPWGDAVNFEAEGSDEVRRFFCDNALMWLRDFHIDGLRLDAVHEFVDRSAVHFLEQLAGEVAAEGETLGRTFVLIAESDLNDPRVVTPRASGGYGIDAQWSDDFHHALFALLHPGEAGYYGDFGAFQHLAKALNDVFVYDGAYSGYRRRRHGRPVENLPRHSFLGYIQNHDQIGNRAMGDRVEHVAGIDRAKIAAAIVFMSPFVPMLFQGEEFAASTPFQYFADHDDPAMAKSVSEGRKREFAAFGWRPEAIPDPEERATFERSKLNWDELSEEKHREMLDWYRQLIRLRREFSAGDASMPVDVRFDDAERWLIMGRGALQLLVSLGDGECSFMLAPQSRLLACSRQLGLVSGGSVTLASDTVAVFQSAI